MEADGAMTAAPSPAAPLLCVVGPTASGKTALSLDLAEAVDGEIVSADSMQVYRHMDIGTAKLPVSERRGIRHHLIDAAAPTETFSAHQYAELARSAIAGIRARGRLPVLVGGTGLYVRAVVDQFDFTQTARDEELRRQLAREAECLGAQALHARLGRLDPRAADRIHPRDLRRIIRALEVVMSTGRPLTASFSADGSLPRARMIGLTLPRDALYRRIDRRVDHMMEMGLLREVEALAALGCTREHTAMQAIGYKELLAVLHGGMELAEAVAAIKRASRRYAKRQLSWFRADPRVRWCECPEDDMMMAARRREIVAEALSAVKRA